MDMIPSKKRVNDLPVNFWHALQDVGPELVGQGRRVITTRGAAFTAGWSHTRPTVAQIQTRARVRIKFRTEPPSDIETDPKCRRKLCEVLLAAGISASQKVPPPLSCHSMHSTYDPQHTALQGLQVCIQHATGATFCHECPEAVLQLPTTPPTKTLQGSVRWRQIGDRRQIRVTLFQAPRHGCFVLSLSKQ